MSGAEKELVELRDRLGENCSDLWGGLLKRLPRLPSMLPAAEEVVRCREGYQEPMGVTTVEKVASCRVCCLLQKKNLPVAEDVVSCKETFSSR